LTEIAGLFALSHSPFWDLSLDVEGPGREFLAGVLRARTAVAATKPDALVIFGPDHFRNFFYDVLPPFCIGAEAVDAFGDYDIPAGPLPVARALGREIHARVSDSGFDPAISLKMGVDHGIVQPYDVLAPGRRIPMVPIMVNCGGAPRPGLQRCLDFGRAVGAAIRASSFPGRVLILASGGLSHWVRPVSEEDPRTDAEIRDYTIGGRDRAQSYSAMRDASVRDRKTGGVDGKVNADWDREVLALMEHGDLGPLLSADPAEMEATAGNGSHEVRCWVAALGAWGGPVETLSYEPVPSWSTGMGCIAGARAAQEAA
jgi:2,3-dihydroxyphenylpropionate 1,2-dioxygenase